MANIRAAYAAVSTDVLTDPKTTDTANKVNYADGKYTATVTAVQTKAKWQSDSDKDTMDIGGQTVSAVTSGSTWTITGDVAAGTVTISTGA